MTGEEILLFYGKGVAYGLLFGCLVGFLSNTKYFR